MVLKKKHSVFLSGLFTPLDIKHLTGFIFILTFFLFFPARAQAMGLEVDPEQIKIEDCLTGAKLAVSELKPQGAKLQIHNKSAQSFTYTITPLYRSDVNIPLEKGYFDIPDTSWITPQNKEIFIPAGETKEIELYLTIPKRKKYRNKNYQAVIEIKSKKNNPEDIFVLAVQIKMLFSTKRK